MLTGLNFFHCQLTLDFAMFSMDTHLQRCTRYMFLMLGVNYYNHLNNKIIYQSSVVMNEFTRAFDNHMRIPKKVPGRGKRYASKLWLDARDMSSMRALPFHKKTKNRRMQVALNEYQKYFYASANYDYLEPGKHTTLRIKQVQNIATSRFMDQDLLSRQCRFPHENPGCKSMYFKS